MKQPLAYIHPDANIAPTVEIKPFTTIDKNVVIGEGTRIGSNVRIMEGARIGKNCHIFPGAVIGAIPQDLKFRGEETLAVIGDNTTIREFATVNRVTITRGKTMIGNNCLIMAYCHIAHDCILGNNIIMANTIQLAGVIFYILNAVVANVKLTQMPLASVNTNLIELEEIELNNEELYFVFFHDSNSELCEKMRFNIEKLIENNQEPLSFYAIDVSKNPGSFYEYNISGIPNILVFKGDKEIKRIMGIVSYKNLASTSAFMRNRER